MVRRLTPYAAYNKSKMGAKQIQAQPLIIVHMEKRKRIYQLCHIERGGAIRNSLFGVLCSINTLSANSFGLDAEGDEVCMELA